ncbi:hypothetical protein GCM10009792_13590 [Microcella alkalica]|uniref:Excisionase family DNA binding protein n=1 Tax=Microcella alkalica TaxID=355930 RepID=A0A839E679_9MICO|nr:helix-turn-helix domain-containing protein [Microcella alkalica]MBA8847037.1 excisionase family DNA binding protein [Microcella alkalica]
MPEHQSIARASWGSLQDAAEHWDLSVKTIRRYIAAGQIEARRVGPRAIRVNLDSLDSLGTPLRYTGGDAA